jgi:hypothetical protein
VTTEQLAEMRNWLADCVWGDMEPEDFADHELVPDADVLTAVRKTYSGGADRFIQDMA